MGQRSGLAKEEKSDQDFVRQSSGECLIQSHKEAPCTPCDENGLTIAALYFNEIEMLTNMLITWSTWSKQTKDATTFTIVDDGSDEAASAMSVLREVSKTHVLPTIRVLTIKENIYRNDGGGRNLAMYSSSSCRTLLLDIDYIVPEAFAKELSALRLPNDVIWQLPRSDRPDKPFHPAILVTRPSTYFKIGGCDEDFGGHYGYVDSALIWRAKRANIRAEKLKADHQLIPNPKPDKHQPKGRDTKVNFKLYKDKRENIVPWSTTFLRFHWDDVLWHPSVPGR